MRRASLLNAWFALALLGCGGSRLPAYAQGEGSLKTDAELADGDFILYRKLTRDDFKGTAPVGAAAGHADRIGAQTYAIIKHEPGIQISGEQRDGTFRCKVYNVRFRAWMDRSKSWWNPKPGGSPESYVLEHEQIHFALVELEGRKVNREAQKIMGRTFEGSSMEEIQADVQEELNEIVADGLEQVKERNLDFDNDTSGVYEPKKQKEWLATVESELAEGG